jgi:hypothetical protein
MLTKTSVDPYTNTQREELFAAVDEVSDIHMTLKGQLEEARAAHERGMMERAEAEAEVKEVRERLFLQSKTWQLVCASDECSQRCSLHHHLDFAQMEAEIAQQNKIQASIRQETYLLKKSANELKDQIANLSIALRDLQAEERQLSKEIVHSPDRIKVDLADAIQKLERVKKTIVEKQNEKHTVQKMLKHTASAEESVRQVITTDLRELETKVKAYKLAVKELNEAQNKLRGMEEDLEEKKQVKEMQMKQLEAVGKLVVILHWWLHIVLVDFTISRAYNMMYRPACTTLSLSLSNRKTQSRNQSHPHQSSPIDTN